MKHILNYIKLTLALVLFLQVGEGIAQTIPASNTVTTGLNKRPTDWTILNGSTDISNRTSWAGSASAWVGTVNNPPNGHTVWVSGIGAETVGPTITGLIVGKTYDFTFYMAELQNAAGVPSGGSISTTFDGVLEVGSYAGVVNSFTYTSLATYPFTGGSSTAWSQKTLTFTATATTFNVAFRYQNAPANNGNFWNVSVSADAVTLNCPLTTAPPLTSGTTINNSSCATPYISLNSLVTGSLPSGASLVWYTNNTRTGNPVLDPIKVAASGTYYAFYYDATNDCYSPATAAVTATYTVCPVNITTTCPDFSVDLSSRVTETAPVGYTYSFHTSTPATATNKLTSSVVTTSGTYYVGTFSTAESCYTATSRPIAVTITNCCANITAAGVN
jgi:hypothetical protein